MGGLHFHGVIHFRDIMVRRPLSGSALQQMKHWREDLVKSLGASNFGSSGVREGQEILVWPANLSRGGERAVDMCANGDASTFLVTQLREMTNGELYKVSATEGRERDYDCIYSFGGLIRLFPLRFLRERITFDWTYFLDGRTILILINQWYWHRLGYTANCIVAPIARFNCNLYTILYSCWDHNDIIYWFSIMFYSWCIVGGGECALFGVTLQWTCREGCDERDSCYTLPVLNVLADNDICRQVFVSNLEFSFRFWGWDLHSLK